MNVLPSTIDLPLNGVIVLSIDKPAFSVAAPTIWIQLAITITSFETTTTFKKMKKQLWYFALVDHKMETSMKLYLNLFNNISGLSYNI